MCCAALGVSVGYYPMGFPLPIGIVVYTKGERESGAAESLQKKYYKNQIQFRLCVEQLHTGVE